MIVGELIRGDAAFLAAVGAILFIAACLQGMSGFGFGMVAMSLLPFVISARTASVVVAFMALSNTLYLAWRVRRTIDFKLVSHLLIGSAVGVPIGVYALRVMPDDMLKRLIGLSILGYCIYLMVRKFRRRPPGPGLSLRWRVPVGLTAGMLGGAINVGGPPVILYLYSQPWDRELIRATLIAYFVLTTILKVAFVSVGGLVTRDMAVYALGFPVIWAGGGLGLWLGRRLRQSHFDLFIAGSLALLGALLLIGG